MKRQAPLAGTFPAVFRVANDGQVMFRQVHADLVLATCQQFNIQQRDALRMAQDLVGRVGQLAPLRIRGRVHAMDAVFDEVSCGSAQLAIMSSTI